MHKLFRNIKVSLKPFSQTTNKINYGWSNSPFGQCVIFIKSSIIVGLAFKNDHSKDQIEIEMKSQWKKSNIDFVSTSPKKLAEQFFYNEEVNIAVAGSQIQVKVWDALLNVQKGATATYTEIAHAAGYPKAIRAVASAVGKNPIAWLIPCHRVIRKSGDNGGYRWGSDIKSKMLAYEAQNKLYRRPDTLLADGVISRFPSLRAMNIPDPMIRIIPTKDQESGNSLHKK